MVNELYWWLKERLEIKLVGITFLCRVMSFIPFSICDGLKSAAIWQSYFSLFSLMRSETSMSSLVRNKWLKLDLLEKLGFHTCKYSDIPCIAWFIIASTPWVARCLPAFSDILLNYNYLLFSMDSYWAFNNLTQSALIVFSAVLNKCEGSI